ncbi:MAG: PQQ-binding-like beta-propeller repeat protein, partial [Deltaproteobacteria bacterium]|nr:PQQ-binding-like beta-propeller repeat protein [Deltaproteobacteria bacterium]
DGGTCGLVHHADGEEAWGLFLRDDDGDGTPEVLAKVDLATGAVLATQAMYNPSGQQDVWFRVPRVVTDGLVRIVQLGSQGLSRLLDAGLHPKNKPYVLGSQAAGSPFLAGRGPGDLPVLFQGTPSGQVLSLLHTVDLATPVPLPLEPAGPPQAGILVGLLDRDGDDTHLALVQRSGGQDSVELALLSPPAEGDALWSWTLPPGKVLYNAAFPRLLAGGGEDVVLQLHDPQGPEGSLLVALAGSDGALRWSVSGQLPYASRPVRGMDLDGDGREEVVSGAHGSSLAFYSPEDGALLWDSDVSSGFDTQNVNALAAASLAPGGPGIVVASSIKVLGLQVVASEPWTVEALWSRPASLPTAPAILDLDGDGGDDVIYWTSNDGLLALDGGTGAVLWNRRFQGGDLLPEGSLLVGHSMAAPAAGDLDGNGTQELLVASSDGFLYALDAATGAVPLWRVFFGVRLFAPLLADLDGLGHLEAFVQTGDGYLYMLDQLAP